MTSIIEDDPSEPGYHQPTNRGAVSMDWNVYEIEDLDGIRHFDPNSMVMAIANGEHRFWKPDSSLHSELFGSGPAVWYRFDDMQLRLTLDELENMMMLRLSPAEYFTLRNRYGIFFQIHDDFYDEATGEALQPHGKRC